MNSPLTKILCLAGFLVVPAGFAETIRVTSWNLDRSSAILTRNPVPSRPETAQAAVAAILRKLNSDVVCLQGVPDWQTCSEICRLAGGDPPYKVVTCSSFSKGSGFKGQVAILARGRTAIAWSDEIVSGDSNEPLGRLAVAVVEAGKKRLALFSIASASSAVADDSISAELFGRIGKIERWRENRPETSVVAGEWARPAKNAIDLFETAGFASLGDLQPAAVHSPADAAPGSSRMVAKNARFLTYPKALSTPVYPYPSVTCDLDLDYQGPARHEARLEIVLPGETRGPAPLQTAAAPPPVRSIDSFSALLLAGFVLLLAAVAILFWRTRRPVSGALELMPASTPPTLIPGAGAGARGRASDPRFKALLPYLGEWMKQWLTRRLLKERSDLIEHQEFAADRTVVIEERLAKIQSDIQDRITNYEKRIERLESELVAAEAENRELIRDQIVLLKKQLAQAKAADPLMRN